MRTFMVLLMLAAPFDAAFAGRPAEMRAMDRVIVRLWPAADQATRARLAEVLAKDVHRQDSTQHSEAIRLHAVAISDVMGRALRARRAGGAGASQTDVQRVISALVRGYQVAAADRYDAVNSATCLTAMVVIGSQIVPLCIAIASSGDSADATAVIESLRNSAIIGTVAGMVGGAYFLNFKALPTIPGMSWLSHKYPGNDFLTIFWDDVNRDLFEQVEWQVLRGHERLRHNVELERFVALLKMVAPEDAVPRACQNLLESGGVPSTKVVAHP